jgi:hypothetical protein
MKCTLILFDPYSLQVKEHVCSECGKAFGQKGDLVKHIKTIHEQVRLLFCFVLRLYLRLTGVAFLGACICLPSVQQSFQREGEHDATHAHSP